MHIEQKLAELQLVLPMPSAPVAAYVPYVVAGGLVFISGQLPMQNGVVAVTGRLGAEVDVTAGYGAARLCALHLLAQLSAACAGDLDRVARVVRLGAFVSCMANFYDHPKVVNGASELLQEIFGEAGRHARTSLGVASLPLNAAVEIEGVFALRT